MGESPSTPLFIPFASNWVGHKKKNRLRDKMTLLFLILFIEPIGQLQVNNGMHHGSYIFDKDHCCRFSDSGVTYDREIILPI